MMIIDLVGKYIVPNIISLCIFFNLWSITDWSKIEKRTNISHSHPCVYFVFLQSDSAYRDMEEHALKLAAKIGAEYWAVSSKTGPFINFFSHCAI